MERNTHYADSFLYQIIQADVEDRHMNIPSTSTLQWRLEMFPTQKKNTVGYTFASECHTEADDLQQPFYFFSSRGKWQSINWT